MPELPFLSDKQHKLVSGIVDYIKEHGEEMPEIANWKWLEQ
jgi:phosphoketolase